MENRKFTFFVVFIAVFMPQNSEQQFEGCKCEVVAAEDCPRPLYVPHPCPDTKVCCLKDAKEISKDVCVCVLEGKSCDSKYTEAPAEKAKCCCPSCTCQKECQNPFPIEDGYCYRCCRKEFSATGVVCDCVTEKEACMKEGDYIDKFSCKERKCCRKC